MSSGCRRARGPGLDAPRPRPGDLKRESTRLASRELLADVGSEARVEMIAGTPTVPTAEIHDPSFTEVVDNTCELVSMALAENESSVNCVSQSPRPINAQFVMDRTDARKAIATPDQALRPEPVGAA